MAQTNALQEVQSQARPGDDEWSARVVPSIGVELSHEQALACAFRVLVREDFSENIAGHITWVDREDTSMLVNPWGLWWTEVTASDICRVDSDANVIEGRWDVTPAVQIHTELHRARPDARVVVHNHPYWSTVLASLGELPEILHQTACLFHEEMVLVDEYDGSIESPGSGAALASAIGSARVALLVNHGVVVTGETLEEAVYRSASFDRQCRLAYHVLQSGRVPRKIPASVQHSMRQILVNRAPSVYWSGAVRQLLKTDPGVLD